MTWPTENSLYYLLFGLVPLAYCAFQVLRRGCRELLSLGFAGVTFTWIGFHISPWIFYLTGEWANGIMCEDYLDEGLFFTTCAMLAFLLGYEWAMRRWQGDTRMVPVDDIHLPQINAKWIIFFSLVLCFLFLLKTRGPENVWRDTLPRSARGVHIWETVVTPLEKLEKALGSVTGPVSACLAILASIVILGPESRSGNRRYVLGGAGLAVASLDSIWDFSREAGLGIFVLTIVAIKLKGRRAIPLATACLLLVLWFNNTSMKCRGVYNPGLGNFMEAAFSGKGDGNNEPTRLLDLHDLNPLEFMHAWTRKADVRDFDSPPFFENAIAVVWNLNPLPSALVPPRDIGPNLTFVMGTEGICGLNTPALGELYYAFRYWGLILIIPLGMLHGWFEAKFRQDPTTVFFLCFLLCFISFPLGIHQGIRPMSRPLWYGVIFVLGSRSWQHWQNLGNISPNGEAVPETLPCHFHGSSIHST